MIIKFSKELIAKPNNYLENQEKKWKDLKARDKVHYRLNNPKKYRCTYPECLEVYFRIKVSLDKHIREKHRSNKYV